MSEECEGKMPPVAPEHQELQAAVGKWDVDCTFHNMPEPMKCGATDTVESLGPYWIVATFECEFPGMPMPFKGLCQMGFDMGAGEYCLSWIDMFSPQMTLLRGKRGDDGVLRMSGDGLKPETGEPCAVRSEEQPHDDGTKSFKMWFGDELAFEYLYRRSS